MGHTYPGPGGTIGPRNDLRLLWQLCTSLNHRLESPDMPINPEIALGAELEPIEILLE